MTDRSNIDANLGADLTLAELADVACFSRFHFHRIFSAMVGETVTDYLKRIRLQNAASRLINNPRDSVTDIAMACGFSSPSVFAGAFKDRFGVSASTWRAGGWRAPGSAGAARTAKQRATPVKRTARPAKRATADCCILASISGMTGGRSWQSRRSRSR